MRKILFTAIVLLVLLLAAEVGITLLSQHGMERAMRSQYGLPPSLEVNINSFPYLVSLASNHLGELQLTWDGEIAYAAQDDQAQAVPYAGRVNLYDVELDMPALLRAKLEIRDISRIEAYLSLDIAGLSEALASSSAAFFIEDGKLYGIVAGEKVQYAVKVAGDHTLILEPWPSSTQTAGSDPNPDAMVQTIDLDGLPMGSTMDSASIEGDRVIVKISIPLWEGYLP